MYSQKFAISLNVSLQNFIFLNINNYCKNVDTQKNKVLQNESVIKKIPSLENQINYCKKNIETSTINIQNCESIEYQKVIYENCLKNKIETMNKHIKLLEKKQKYFEDYNVKNVKNVNEISLELLYRYQENCNNFFVSCGYNRVERLNQMKRTLSDMQKNGSIIEYETVFKNLKNFMCEQLKYHIDAEKIKLLNLENETAYNFEIYMNEKKDEIATENKNINTQFSLIKNLNEEIKNLISQNEILLQENEELKKYEFKYKKIHITQFKINKRYHTLLSNAVILISILNFDTNYYKNQNYTMALFGNENYEYKNMFSSYYNNTKFIEFPENKIQIEIKITINGLSIIEYFKKHDIYLPKNFGYIEIMFEE